MIKIAIMGYGTVGSGVVEVLEKNRGLIETRADQEIQVKYVLDLREFEGDPIQPLIVHDFDVILQDKEIEIVVEVMGGVEPAYTFAKCCLEAGKSVVTSNKALVAARGAQLLEIARAKGINFLFEASVGGGIPILRALNASLTADEVEEVTGILNGTTNYMLSKMFYENAEYDAVLKEAQEKGYAERNPEADVEGYDACRKIAILASIISGRQVDYEDIYTEGVTNITAKDMQYVKVMGMTVKLLASCSKRGETVSAMVAPFLLQQDHPLYHVDDVYNAVFVHGNMLGDAMFYGSGAGKLPTASAVVADVIDAAKHLNRSVMPSWSVEKLELEDWKAIKRRFFVRVKGKPADLCAQLEHTFGPVQVVQLEQETEEFAFLTDIMTEGQYKACAEEHKQIIHRIRLV